MINILKYFSTKQIFLPILALLFCLSTFSQQGNLRFDHLTIENGLPQNTIHGIVQDKYDFMWFGTWSGLCRFDGYKFTYFQADPANPRALPSKRIYLLYKDANQDIWIATNDTTVMSRYNYETNDFTTFNYKDLQPELVDSLKRRKNYSRSHINTINTQWRTFDENSSLVETDRKTRQQYIYKADPLNRWAISDQDATDLYLDSHDILWVGTYSGGINKANTGIKPFYYYYHTFKDDNCIVDNNVRGICEDNNGNLWVGSRSMGLTKIDRKNNTYTRFQHNEKDPWKGLISDQIRSIYNDRYGYIWIGTKDGLDRFDPRNNRFYHYTTTTKSSITHNWVYAITEDHSGNLWIGTWKGIAKYDRKKDKFLSFDLKSVLKSEIIRSIIVDSKGNLWVATSGGGVSCLRIDTSNVSNEKLFLVHNYINALSDPNSLSFDLVYTLVEDENGIIWAGTNSGLNRIDPKTNSVRRFMAENGLPDETILGILSDHNGHVWFSHRKGISRLDAKTFEIRNYTIYDGLQGVEFNENAFYRSSKTGEMFFGGINGLNAFMPNNITENKSLPPKIVITDLQILNTSVPVNAAVNGHIVLTKPVYMTSEITLTQKDRSINIEFAALHYANPQSNKYAHKLEGFDQDWIYTDASDRTATYSNLEPKTYIFKVKGSNSEGIWNPTPTTLSITVLPPWWKTWWFRLIAGLAVIATLSYIYFSRVQYYENQKILLEKTVDQKTSELQKMNSMLLKQTEELNKTNTVLEERQEQIEQQSEELLAQKESVDIMNGELHNLNATKDKFFSIIAHDIKNPFNAILGFSELLNENYKEWTDEQKLEIIGLIHSSSKNLYQLLENLLQWSRSQRGIIEFNPEKIELADLLSNVTDIMKGTAESKNIELSVTIPENGLAVYADRQMLDTIVRNLISNALKFTNSGGKVQIIAEMSGEFVTVKVTDNGIGIRSDVKDKLFKIDSNITTYGTANETGTGLGLILVKEFVDRNGGKIGVDSVVGEGSTFHFTIPVAKS
jgi:signal transduction histidine kinase/ligand-binding sensor domain-containing protein